MDSTRAQKSCQLYLWLWGKFRSSVCISFLFRASHHTSLEQSSPPLGGASSSCKISLLYPQDSRDDFPLRKTGRFLKVGLSKLSQKDVTHSIISQYHQNVCCIHETYYKLYIISVFIALWNMGGGVMTQKSFSQNYKIPWETTHRLRFALFQG